MPRRIAQLGILFLAAAALIFAWHLSLDYFDAFDTLANARKLVGNGYGDYVAKLYGKG